MRIAKNLMFMNIVHKARVLETKIKVYLSNRKQIKTQWYRRFLQNPSRPLLSYKQLRKWRNTFFYTAIICLCIPCMQTVFFYNTIWEEPEPPRYGQEITTDMFLKSFYTMIPMIFGIIFMMLGCFSAMFDWCIYRRWGKNRSILHW